MNCIRLHYYKQKMGSGTKPTDLMASTGWHKEIAISEYGDLDSFSPINCKGHNFSPLALFFLRKNPHC